MADGKVFNVYTVVGQDPDDKDSKGFWVRIGTAWPHSKGDGYNAILDALPVNGKIVILPRKDDEDKDDRKRDDKSDRKRR